jgi:hypothetical protein
MAKPNLEPVNLGSVAKGALMELFELEIAKIAANIDDKSTKATKKRVLTLQLTFNPDPDRRSIDVTTWAITKLAPVADHASRVYLGKDESGRAYLFNEDPRQELLFEPPEQKENVLDFKAANE